MPLRFIIASMLLCSLHTHALAKSYPSHAVTSIIKLTSHNNESVLSVDYNKLDALLTDLSAHIDPPPARFDTPADEKKAKKELNDILIVLQKIQYGQGDLKLMRRSAYALQMGHMMGIKDTTEELHQLYARMLAKFPKQADIETQYGLLWLQEGKWDKAEFYFDRAAKLGFAPAIFLGVLAHKEQGEIKEALGKLAQYKKLQPNDPRIAPLERVLVKK